MKYGVSRSVEIPHSNILSRNGMLLSSFLTRAFRLDPVARNRALIPHDTFFRSEATRKSRGNATKLPKPVSEVWQVPRYNELPFQLPTTHRLAAMSLSSIVSRMFRARAKLRATGQSRSVALQPVAAIGESTFLSLPRRSDA